MEKEGLGFEFSADFSSFDKSMSKVGDMIADSTDGIGDSFEDMGKSIAVSVNKIEKSTSNLSSSVSDMESDVSDSLNDVSDSFDGVSSDIGKSTKDIDGSVSDLSDSLSSVSDGFDESADNISDIAKSIDSTFSDMVSTTKRTVDSINREISGVDGSKISVEFSDSSDNVSESTENIENDIQKMKKTIDSVESSSVNMSKSMNSMSVSFGSTSKGLNNMKDDFSSLGTTIETSTGRISSSTRRVLTDTDKMALSFLDYSNDVANSTASATADANKMASEMRKALKSNNKAMAETKKKQAELNYEFLKLSTSAKEFNGSTNDYIASLTALGVAQNNLTSAAQGAGGALAMAGVLIGIGTLLGMKTQSEKAAEGLDTMKNKLYQLSKPALKVTGFLEKLSKKGSVDVLALKRVGKDADSDTLLKEQGRIRAGLMRLGPTFLVTGASALAFYGMLSKALMGVKPEEVRSQQADITKAFKEAYDKRVSDVANFAGLFEKATLKSVKKVDLTKALQSQVKSISIFNNSLSILTKRGVDEGLIKELRSAGPKAAGEIQALSKMSDKELSNYVKLWQERGSLAKDSVGIEMAPQKAEMDKQIKELKDSITPLGEAVSEFTKTWGKSLGPFLEDLGTVLSKVVELGTKIGKFLGNLEKEHPALYNFILTFATLLPAFMTFLSVLSVAIGIVDGFLAALSFIMPLIEALIVGLALVTAPTWAVVAAVAALIIGGIYLWKNWDKVSKWLKKTWNKMGDWFIEAKDKILDSLDKFLTLMEDSFSDAFEGWADIFSGMGDWFINAKDSILGALDDLLEWIGFSFSDAYEGWGLLFSDMGDWFINAKDSVLGALDDLITWISEGLQGGVDFWKGIFGEIGDFFGGVTEKVKGYATDASTWLKDKFSGVGSSIKDKFSGMSQSVKDSFNQIKGKGTELFDKFKNSELGKDLAKGMKSDTIQKLLDILSFFNGTFIVRFFTSNSKFMTNLREKVSNGWNNIKSKTMEKLNSIGEFFGKWFGIVKEKWNTGLNFIKDAVRNKINSVRDSFKNKLNSLKEFFTNWFATTGEKWTQGLSFLKDLVKSKMEDARESFKNKLNKMKEFAVTYFPNLSKKFGEGLDLVKNIVSSRMESIRKSFKDKMNAVKNFFAEYFPNLTNTFREKLGRIRDVASNIFKDIKKFMLNPIKETKDKIFGIIDRIKEAFAKMKIAIPKPKIPKVSVSMVTKFKGKGGLPPMEVPEFDLGWYKTGGIATGPSVVGIGEAGDEAILPLSNKSKMRPFAETTAKMMNGNVNGKQSGGDIFEIHVHQMMDGKEIGRAVYKISEEEARKTKGRNAYVTR